VQLHAVTPDGASVNCEIWAANPHTVNPNPTFAMRLRSHPDLAAEAGFEPPAFWL